MKEIYNQTRIRGNESHMHLRLQRNSLIITLKDFLAWITIWLLFHKYHLIYNKNSCACPSLRDLLPPWRQRLLVLGWRERKFRIKRRDPRNVKITPIYSMVRSSRATISFNIFCLKVIRNLTEFWASSGWELRNVSPRTRRKWVVIDGIVMSSSGSYLNIGLMDHAQPCIWICILNKYSHDSCLQCSERCVANSVIIIKKM